MIILISWSICLVYFTFFAPNHSIKISDIHQNHIWHDAFSESVHVCDLLSSTSRPCCPFYIRTYFWRTHLSNAVLPSVDEWFHWTAWWSTATGFLWWKGKCTVLCRGTYGLEKFWQRGEVVDESYRYKKYASLNFAIPFYCDLFIRVIEVTVFCQ